MPASEPRYFHHLETAQGASDGIEFKNRAGMCNTSCPPGIVYSENSERH